ncbi:MAG: hypothetical protein HY801_02135 [Candidatus Lindowbacteria bacterium]|nr:hypothetical protein [Candidatus Lindowbacteria bacterium]
MAKRKRAKPKKGGYTRTIPETAKPVRFFIILGIGVALFLALFFFAVIRGGR